MAQRDRAWRRTKTRTLFVKVQEIKRRFASIGRPHAAQKARVWWGTEQELREAL